MTKDEKAILESIARNLVKDIDALDRFNRKLNVYCGNQMRAAQYAICRSCHPVPLQLCVLAKRSRQMGKQVETRKEALPINRTSDRGGAE